MVRRRGKWLEELGVNIGCDVCITGKPGQFVIDVVAQQVPKPKRQPKPWEVGQYNPILRPLEVAVLAVVRSINI